MGENYPIHTGMRKHNVKIDAVYLSGLGGKLKCCWEITQVRNLPELRKQGGGVTFVIRSFLAVLEFFKCATEVWKACTANPKGHLREIRKIEDLFLYTRERVMTANTRCA